MKERIPSRVNYNLKTKRGVEKFMQDFLDELGLHNWKFRWSRGKKTLGHCNLTRGEIRLSAFAHKHLSEEHIYNTLVHEVAHALTPGARHGPTWKSMMRRLGQNPNTTYRMKGMNDEFIAATEKQYKWAIECPTCKTTIARYMRKPGKKFQRGQKKHITCGTVVTFRRI